MSTLTAIVLATAVNFVSFPLVTLHGFDVFTADSILKCFVTFYANTGKHSVREHWSK